MPVVQKINSGYFDLKWSGGRTVYMGGLLFYSIWPAVVMLQFTRVGRWLGVTAEPVLVVYNDACSQAFP